MRAYITAKAVAFLSFVAVSGAYRFPDLTDALNRLHGAGDGWNYLERAWSTPVDPHWLQTIAANNTPNGFRLSGVSSECTLDLQKWVNSLRKLEMWAIESELNSSHHTV